MKLAKTLVVIDLGLNDRVPSGSIREFSDTQFDELKNFGALREATSEEAAIFRREQVTVDPEIIEARQLLESKAFDLGVEFRSNISDAKLQYRISQAKASQRD